VSNVPKVVDDATADTAMFLILATLRGFNNGIMAIRDGAWRGHIPPPLGHDPQGKVLGILGLGGIGRNLKKKAEVFGMKVIYYNRSQLSEDLADGAEYVTFDELLARSDVLSLHLPLNVSRSVQKRTPTLVAENYANGNYLAVKNTEHDLDQGI
jgi:glyoxylate reductase